MKNILQVLVYGGVFLILFLPLVVTNELFFPYITGKNFAFRIIVELIFGSWLLLALFDERYRPRFSWVMAGMSTFIVVICTAAVFGENVATSFWSNYERMDGVVTLIHLALFFLVLGSMRFSSKTWNAFLATSVGVAAFVALRGLADISDGETGRVDSTLGNAAYMAVYMLFNIFFSAFLFIRSCNPWSRFTYAAAMVLFVSVLLLTGTRGTFLGLVGGSFVTVLYVAIFGARFPEYRKVAIGGVLLLLVLAGSFYAARDSAFVQDNTALRRIANIDLKEDLVVRSTIWTLTIEGIKDRPFLGWGHGNFNFVFNQNYDPALYDQEQWFDRVHNIFLDWLISAGVLGFLAYFSIIAAVLYYLFWLPLWRKEADPFFNVLERAVLIGLLVGYLIHNVVVFDNIISYIFYGVLLALIHSTVSTPIRAVQEFSIDRKIVTQMVTPIVLVATIATVYYVNVPSMLAANDIIDGLRGRTVPERLDGFERALGRGGFGEQEIVEQMVQQATQIIRNPELDPAEKEAFLKVAGEALIELVEKKPGDARLHIFLANLYQVAGMYNEARQQAEIAHSLSPRKPSIIVEQGVIELNSGDMETAMVFFKEAHDLAPGYQQARILYAALLTYTGEEDQARELLADPKDLTAFAQNSFTFSMAEKAASDDFLDELEAVREQ